MNSEYVRVFKALSDANRIRILELLCESEECACVLLDDLQISQATLSHHMKILCDSGIVTYRQEGKWKYYRINTDGCEYAIKLIEKIRNEKLGGIVRFLTWFSRLFRMMGKIQERRGRNDFFKGIQGYSEGNERT